MCIDFMLRWVWSIQLSSLVHLSSAELTLLFEVLEISRCVCVLCLCVVVPLSLFFTRLESIEMFPRPIEDQTSACVCVFSWEHWRSREACRVRVCVYALCGSCARVPSLLRVASSFSSLLRPISHISFPHPLPLPLREFLHCFKPRKCHFEYSGNTIDSSEKSVFS